MFVAAARGAAGVDPFASRLVPQAFVGTMRLASFGLVAHLRVRTEAIDEMVRAGSERGVTQIVILGAGLDARAWRLGATKGSVVYEVDHPATQQFKRRRLGAEATCAREVVFVGVDFERDDLEERLAHAGHDAARPTTWIWEGVTPYLTAGAIDATLAIVERRSCEGSALAMTYVTPDLANAPRALHPLAHTAFRVLGEPIRGAMSTASAAAALQKHHFTPDHDDLLADLAVKRTLPRPWFVMAERLVVASYAPSVVKAA